MYRNSNRKFILKPRHKIVTSIKNNLKIDILTSNASLPSLSITKRNGLLVNGTKSLGYMQLNPEEDYK